MADFDLPAILEERLVGGVVDQRVEESVLRLDVGEQRFSLGSITHGGIALCRSI